MTNTILSFPMHGNWHASVLPATRSNFFHDNIMNENYILFYTSHSKTNSEESIPIPVWSSYLNFTLIFIDFPGTSNPEPISHIKIALQIQYEYIGLSFY